LVAATIPQLGDFDMRRLTAFLASAVWALGISALAHAAGGEAFIDPEQAGPDYKVQGEYEGTIGNETKFGAQVIALGEGKFDVVLFTKGLPGGPKDAAWDGKTKVTLKGETNDGVVLLSGQNFKGEIKGGTISGTAEENVKYAAKKVERKSPTLGAKPPEGAIVLFDGTNVDAWQNGKLVEKDLLAVGTRTKQKFEDFTLHLEFRTPFMPSSRGQGRGNSGMYLVDQYECQVLDSFGLSGENNECGGLYSVAKPIVNMCLPPLAWQTYDVDFRCARFDAAGKKTDDAVVTIKHNGVVIHDKLKLKPTPGGGQTNNEEQPGALYLQDHGNPVHFRNIWIVEKK
jgi:3-keto-disaccharide hydrolase